MDLLTLCSLYVFTCLLPIHALKKALNTLWISGNPQIMGTKSCPENYIVLGKAELKQGRKKDGTMSACFRQSGLWKTSPKRALGKKHEWTVLYEIWGKNFKIPLLHSSEIIINSVNPLYSPHTHIPVFPDLCVKLTYLWYINILLWFFFIWTLKKSHFFEDRSLLFIIKSPNSSGFTVRTIGEDREREKSVRCASRICEI